MSSRSLILASALFAAACGETAPTQPSNPRPLAQFVRQPVCAPVGVEVHCTVQAPLNGVGDVDVTASATWTVAESNSSDGFTSIDVAVVAAPGRIVPVRSGNIAIHVRIPGAHNVAQHTYAVDPAAPAIVLAPAIAVAVTDATTGASIPDAKVEIISGGIDTGKSIQTLGNGAGSLQHLRMGVAFTIRASKAGYVASDMTTAPIVDDEQIPGLTTPRTLRFALQQMTKP